MAASEGRGDDRDDLLPNSGRGSTSTSTSSTSSPSSSSVDRPVRSSEAGAGAGPASASRRAPERAPRNGSLLPAVLASLVLGLLIGGAAMTFLNRSDPKADGFGGTVDTAWYRAVILSNDKVYFGRISSVSAQFFKLQNAFFLRETPGTNGAEPVRALLPVNREIHAPDNTMLIAKDEVVLVENLAKDSPILAEIRRQIGNK